MKPTARKYETKHEWTQQQLVAYGSLVGIGVVILQAFLSAPSLDLPSLLSVFAFAISIPMLSTAILVVHAQASFRYASSPWYLMVLIIAGQSLAFIGVVAALWHLSWIAGVLLLLSGFIGLVIYTTYLRQLELDNKPDPS